MNLQQQYETLLRRGMPEHPRLYYHPGGRGGTPAFVTSLSTVGALYPLTHAADDDARDLITMHALRWWFETERLDWGGEILKRGNIIMDESRVSLGRDGVGVGTAPTILEAILAATERLEKKEEDAI